MDFSYSEAQEQIRTTVRDFAEKEIRPGAAERDRTAKFDFNLIRKLGKLGMCSILYPEEFGGANGDSLSFSLVMEEVARVDYGLAFELPGVLQPLIMLRLSNEEQKNRWGNWFRAAAKGEIEGALGVTEPGTGSNIRAIETTAVVDKAKNEWVINGTKCFITGIGSDECPFIMVLGVTDKGKGTTNLVVVPKGTKGLKIGPRYDLLGIRSVWNGEVVLDDCRVPLDNQIAERDNGRQGVIDFFKIMAPIRAGGEIGLQQGCFDEASRYAKERVAFNKKIGQFQHVQAMLVEMDTNLEISRLLRNKVAMLVDAGTSTVRDRSRLKYFTCEAAITASKHAVQVFGGIGLTENVPVARYYRDARMSNIPGGTTEVHKVNIARQLGFK